MRMEARMKPKPERPKPKEELERELEEGLEETFPASDAPAVTQPVHKPSDEQRDE
jgi:hypothetical protein